VALFSLHILVSIRGLLVALNRLAACCGSPVELAGYCLMLK
jgi:hypothetical protein